MARNLRGPARHGYGDCIKRPGWSAAGESRLVAAGLLVLVDEVGFLVVLVVAVVVGLLGDLIVLVIAVVAVAHGRLAGIGAHTAAGCQESEESGRAHVCTPVTNAHRVCSLRL